MRTASSAWRISDGLLCCWTDSAVQSQFIPSVELPDIPSRRSGIVSRRRIVPPLESPRLSSTFPVPVGCIDKNEVLRPPVHVLGIERDAKDQGPFRRSPRSKLAIIGLTQDGKRLAIAAAARCEKPHEVEKPRRLLGAHLAGIDLCQCQSVALDELRTGRIST